jgi:tetratricopeptide (TPR) repeat protein/transcriptional regulator with XRE-family HTH domain
LSFGDLLKRYRHAAGLSQEALAARAGYSMGHISKLERSARLPMPATAEVLADALTLGGPERAVLRHSLRRLAGLQRPVHPPSGAPSPPASPPLVNRAHELAHLEQHLSGRGRPVLLFTGEPGMGKTRLLQEAAAQGRNLGWSVVASGSLGSGCQGPYAPVLGALQAYVRRDTPARLRSRLYGCTWLLRLLPELAEIASIPVPSWTLPSEEERRLLFAAVERFLTNVAGPAGTLLVLDDLHRADEDGLDLLATLALTHGERPLRIVGAYRNTEVTPDRALAAFLTKLARNRLIKRVVLGPLAPNAIAELVDDLLEGMQPEPDRHAWRESVVREAGGVPLFAVCYADCPQTGGSDCPRTESSAPAEYTQTIHRRMAVLPECAQRVIAIAAVAARTVSRELLVQVARQVGCEESAISAGLDAALQARLLVVEGRQAFTFAHDLIREVIESKLGTAQRAQLHLEVAQALEVMIGVHGAVVSQDLAMHYVAAGESEKALAYLWQAGAGAEAVHANAAAVAYYRALVPRLEALGRVADTPYVREHLGTVLGRSGRYELALEALEQAVEAYRRAGDYESVGRAAAQIGWVHSLRGTIDEGIVRLQRDLLGAVQRSQRGSAALCLGLAHLFSLSGRHTAQLDAATRAADHARGAKDQRFLALAAFERGSALGLLGRLAESLAELEDCAIPFARASADLWTLAHALTLAGDIYLMLGAYDQSSRCAEEAAKVADQVDDADMTEYLRFKRGYIAYYSGDWTRALSDVERAAAAIRHGAAMRWTSAVLIGVGELHQSIGRREQASADVVEGRVLAERSDDLESLRRAHAVMAERDLLEGHAEQVRERLEPLLDRPGQQEPSATALLPLLAQAYLEMDDATYAQALAASSVARAAATGLRPVLTDALRTQALVALRQRRWGDARDALEYALALSRAMAYPYAEARTLFVYGLLHRQNGDREQAVVCLMAGLAILQRLGERFYAERIEQVLAEMERV